MRTSYRTMTRPLQNVVALFSVLLAASYCQAADVNQTGVTSSQLDVIASQPHTVSCAAPAPLGEYDTYCEGLQADYFLLPKQRHVPSLANLKPNVTTFVTSLNDTAAAMSLKGVNEAVAAKKYSFAVRYTGLLFFDISGTYEFSLTSPPGTQLTVNGNTVTFDEGSNTSTPTTGYTFASAGYLPIEMVFFAENSLPSLTVRWQGPSDTIFTVVEGNSLQFNCSSIQNNTNSAPAKSSSMCSGLSAVYYANWANTSYASATGVATFAVYEQGLNHWSTTTTPTWSGLPTTLKTDFAARYHGQLWVPIAGTYSFKLYADMTTRLFVGTANILNSTAGGTTGNVAIGMTADYTFASSGYVPVALNFVSRKSAEAGVLRLAWKGPNSPVYKVVYPFSHPCSTFVACANTSTAGALPEEVVGSPPAGTTIESVTAISSASLATYVPNSNVTFTLGFPGLSPEDPNVEDVAYFVREAVANAAGLKLESVWTVPSLDSTTGDVVFPMGSYFTSLAAAQKFYSTVNLRPQNIFSSSAGLADFYPITVSSPALGTTVATAAAVVPTARPMATLDSATGEDDYIPLPTVTVPTAVTNATANATAMANTTAVVSSPTPTAAAPEASPTAEASAPEASTPTPSPTPAAPTPTPSPTPAAAAPAPVAVETPMPTPVPTEAATPAAPAPAPVAAETPMPTAVPTEAATPAAPAFAPVAAETTTPGVTAVAPVPAVPAVTPSPTVASVLPNPGTGITVQESPAAMAAAPVVAPVASEASPTMGTTMSGTTAGPPVYGAAPAVAPVAAAAVSPMATAIAPVSGSPVVYGSVSSPASAPAGTAASTHVPVSAPAADMGMTGPTGVVVSPASPPSGLGAVVPVYGHSSVAPAVAPATTLAPVTAPTTISPSSSLPSPYASSTISAPADAPGSASPALYSSHPLIPSMSGPVMASAAAPSPAPTTAYPLPSTPPPSALPVAPIPGSAAPSLLPPTMTSPAAPVLSLPADALLVYAPLSPPSAPLPGTALGYGANAVGPAPSSVGTSFIPYSGQSGGARILNPSTSGPVAPQAGAPSSAPLFGGPTASPYAGTYFVPYPAGVGGYMVPIPAGYGPISGNLGGVAAPGAAPGSLFGATPVVVSPSAGKRLPVYYGLPTACKPGTVSCTQQGPYAYYAIDGSSVLTPGVEATLLGTTLGAAAATGQMGAAPMPAPSTSSMALTPAAFIASTPAAAVAAVTPAAAPAASALCACNPSDATPRTVKIEVLSTSYNSTTSDTINFNAYLTFTHPTESLNSSQIRVFTQQPDDGSGTVTTPGTVTLLQPISQNCAFYSLKGYVTESNPFIVNSTDIFLAAGGDILDACGLPFNVTVTQVQQTHRLEGLLYATGVAYSEEAGVLLDTNVLDLALAFTDSVPLLTADMFTVTGPPNMTATALEAVDGSDSYYTFSVTVPESYYGSISVSMDQAGQRYLTSINSAAVAPAALEITRADPVQQGDLVNTTRTHGL